MPYVEPQTPKASMSTGTSRRSLPPSLRTSTAMPVSSAPVFWTTPRNPPSTRMKTHTCMALSKPRNGDAMKSATVAARTSVVNKETAHEATATNSKQPKRMVNEDGIWRFLRPLPASVLVWDMRGSFAAASDF